MGDCSGEFPSPMEYITPISSSPLTMNLSPKESKNHGDNLEVGQLKVAAFHSCDTEQVT